MHGIEVHSIAEIGVWRGHNAQILRALFPKAILYLIDPWKMYKDYSKEAAGPISTEETEFELAYKEVQNHFGKDPNAHILRMSSVEAASLAPNDFDLVFIDGNHEYSEVKKDIAYWLPKIRKGGMLSGHDYAPPFPGVIRAVDESFPSVLKGRDTTWGWVK